MIFVLKLRMHYEGETGIHRNTVHSTKDASPRFVYLVLRNLSFQDTAGLTAVNKVRLSS